MKKRVVSWLLAVVMVVSMLPTSVLADTLAVTEPEQQVQQEEQTSAPGSGEETAAPEDEETDEVPSAVPETSLPAAQIARSGSAVQTLAEGTVSSAEEFAKMNPNGSYTLAEDITIMAPYAEDFSGTFDGAGHTVTLNITTAESSNVGLFASLASGAVIRNVTTAGSISVSVNNVGGIAGNADGNVTIENCKNTASIKGSKAVGGILGYSYPDSGFVTISSCVNMGNVTASSRQAGGIAGNIEGTHVIRDCYNQGNISGSGAAGILGRGAKGVSVSNSYTIGTIGTNGYALIGSLGSGTSCEVSNSYGLKGNGSALTYSSSNVTVTDCAFKSSAEMQTLEFTTTLGDAFRYNEGGYPTLTWEVPTAKVPVTLTPANAVLTLNGVSYKSGSTLSLTAGEYTYTVFCKGYKDVNGTVEVKEDLTATPAAISVTLSEDESQWINVTFGVTPASAKVSVKDGEAEVPSKDGTYRLLKDGNYTYTATTTEEGYEDASGTVDTGKSVQTVALKKVESIKLGGTYKTEYYQGDALDTAGLTVTVTYTDKSTREITEGFQVTGFDSADAVDSQTITVTYKGVTATYKVKINEKTFPSAVFNGLKGYAEVTYSHNSGYKGEDGKEFVDDGANGLKSNSAGMSSSQVTITIKFFASAPKAQLTFDYKVSSEGSSYYASDGLQINNGSKIGGTIDWTTYELTVSGGDTVTLSYTKDFMDDSGSDCVWLKNFAVEPAVVPTEPAKSGDTYLIGTMAELLWFAEAVNGGQTTINGKLTANIDLNSKTWTAIGSNTQPFAGTFDGGRYTISGLVGSNGLFGYVAAGGTVKNVSLDCNITSDSGVGGIANTSKGTIEDCLVSGSVTGGSSGGSMYVGGIVGRSQESTSVIRGCVNKATVKNSYQKYSGDLNTGGIVGYTYGTVENCYSTGAVVARVTEEEKIPNKNIGGLVGAINGNAIVTACYTTGTVTGPAAGIGAFAGTVSTSASVANCYYVTADGIAAVASGSSNGIGGVTADTLKTDDMAYKLGMHKDTGSINNGFPVQPWQGGTAPDMPEDLKAVQDAAAALTLRGMTAADAAKKAEAEWYAEVVWELYAPHDTTDLDDMEYEYGCRDQAGLLDYFYKERGIDPAKLGRLTPDDSGVYQMRELAPVTFDPEEDPEKAIEYVSRLELDKGADGITVTWGSDSELLDVTTGNITAPESGKDTVTLTATVKKGDYSEVKTFTLCLWSAQEDNKAVLADIKDMLAQTYVAIQPMQGVGDSYDENLTDALLRLLEEWGHEGITAEYKGGAKPNGFGSTVEYIDSDGKVTWIKDELPNSTQTVQYTDAKFTLTCGGETAEVTVRARVGRDIKFVQKLLEEKAGELLTWETIRGKDQHSAAKSDAAGWPLYTVQVDKSVVNEAGKPIDGVSTNLLLPVTYSTTGNAMVTVTWMSRDADALTVSDNKDGTYTGVLNRPLKGEAAKTVRLIAQVTYNFFDEATVAHITGTNGIEVFANVYFDITVAPSDRDVSAEIEAALDKYPALIRDFVNKSQTVDLNSVTADLQMPRPAILEDNGIMTDSWYQRVKMVSETPDVLAFNGYHAMVYRPLPGEDAAQARYTITITQDGAILGQKTFTMTIQPFTEEELTAAEKFMQLALEPDTYWNGIKGGNNDKEAVTKDLTSFVEILPDGKGGVTYVKGMNDITFDGIEADDIPGWYDAQIYRSFRSSRPSVVEHELLRVHQPEYNTTVKVDSVLTYTKFAQYWEKFGIGDGATAATQARYARFEQFYKQPISATFTVKGTTGADNPNTGTITATVKVLGYEGSAFKAIDSYTYTAADDGDWTVWDAVQACLKANNYTYTGSGTYVASITDSHGTTLTERAYGEESGWMFRVSNGDDEKTPNTTLVQTYLHDGDVITLFYTDKNVPLDPSDPVDPSTTVPAFGDAYKETKDFAAADTAKYAPTVGSSGKGDVIWGDWIMFSMARSDMELSDAFINAYYAKVEAYVKANFNDTNGTLGGTGSYLLTDNARLVLALTALGRDPADVGGKDLLTALQTLAATDPYSTIYEQVFALLALNSNKYGHTTGLLTAILSKQQSDGSWKTSDEDDVGDVDMTAMALQALAPYYNNSSEEVDDAVDKALTWLSAQYKAGKYTTSESCAQVVVALSALGIDANTDPRFVKGEGDAAVSVLGNLLQYHIKDSGFKHTADGTVDRMATEQGLYALAAYQRYAMQRNSLYDMSDVQPGGDRPEQPDNTGNRYYYTSGGSAGGGKKDSARTADDSRMTLWLGGAVLSAAALAVLAQKKKRITK